MIAALVHTQGFVLHGVFHPLELAYSDGVGVRVTYHIESPIPFSYLWLVAPRTPVQVIVKTRGAVTPRWRVVRFLRERHGFLSRIYGGRRVLFGHKGESYQRDLLDEAGVPRFNLDRLGVPSIARLEHQLLPHVQREPCGNHMHPLCRCSAHVVRLLEEVSSSSMSARPAT